MSTDTGTGSASGWINLTTRGSFPVLRLVRSGCRLRFGNPKGDALRIPSSLGFKPTAGDESHRSRAETISGALGGGTVPKVQFVGFSTNAVGNGAVVSLGEVQNRLPNWCFGVSNVSNAEEPLTSESTT